MSFWLSISLVSGVSCGVLLAILVAPGWFAIGGLLAIVVAVPGLRRPHVASRPYQKWRRAARRYCAVVCLMLTCTCFYTLFVVARLVGSSLGPARPRTVRTMWVPRKSLAITAYAHEYDRPSPGAPPGGWVRTYLSWAARSGQLWAAGLLPFLIVLSFLEPAPERPATANVYTLF